MRASLRVPAEEELAVERAHMVQRQLRARGLADPRVLAAMGRVRRELFVPEPIRSLAYADRALSIGEGQTISQPFMVARSCELLRLTGPEKVLEVGAGSGYQAAVLAELARRVVSVERIPSLAARAAENLRRAGTHNVQIVVGDGTLGHAAEAPYDAIIVAAAAPRVPRALIAQLRDGGRIVLPVGTRDLQLLTVIERQGDELIEQPGDGCIYVPLVGDDGFDEETPIP